MAASTRSPSLPPFHVALSPAHRPQHVPPVSLRVPVAWNNGNSAPEALSSGLRPGRPEWAGPEGCCPLARFLFYRFIPWVLLGTADKCCWSVRWVCARALDLPVCDSLMTLASGSSPRGRLSSLPDGMEGVAGRRRLTSLCHRFRIPQVLAWCPPPREAGPSSSCH